MTTKKVTKSKGYKVSLEMVGKKFTKTAETIDEALANLGLKWVHIKAKGVVTISQGSKSYEHLFYLQTLKRIFANKLTRRLWAKRLEVLFKASNYNNRLK